MDSSRPQTASWRRRALGISGIVAMAVGLYLYAFNDGTASVDFIRASCIKAGLVLLAAWLALPQLDRLPGWVFAGLVTALLALAIRPRVVAILLRYSTMLIPIFAAIWLLRRLAPSSGSVRSTKRIE